jgi:hypothetical protein
MAKDVARADGSVIACNVFEARVQWFDGLKNLYVFDTESNPLMGMTLMAGCRLTIDVIPDGAVSLQLLIK